MEVDLNVTRHIEPSLQGAYGEWDVLILHYLGLDHIGHTYGATRLVSYSFTYTQILTHTPSEKALHKLAQNAYAYTYPCSSTHALECELRTRFPER